MTPLRIFLSCLYGLYFGFILAVCDIHSDSWKFWAIFLPISLIMFIREEVIEKEIRKEMLIQVKGGQEKK